MPNAQVSTSINNTETTIENGVPFPSPGISCGGIVPGGMGVGVSPGGGTGVSPGGGTGVSSGGGTGVGVSSGGIGVAVGGIGVSVGGGGTGVSGGGEVGVGVTPA